MQIALAATLLLAVVWFVALRPKPSTGGQSASTPPAPAQTTAAPSTGAAPGTAGLKGAVDKANGAVATADADARRAAQTSADGSTTTAGGAAASAGASASPDAAAAEPADAAKPSTPSREVRLARSALREHKALALAFVDPRTADARAVAREIGQVSTFDGRAVVLAVPLAQLSDYGFITREVEVTVAPTVVIVDPLRRARTIVGFSDRGEIEQRLADAVAVKRRSR